jgi:hypothetical protein
MADDQGYAGWEPVANDFLTDLRGAKTGGLRRSFHAPFGNDAALYLKVSDEKQLQP